MSIKASLLALALAVSALGAPAADARTAAPTGRLSGLTQITYGCPGPARVDGPPCERWFPFPRARFAVTMEAADRTPIPGTRRVVASDGHGRFTLSLAAGRYTLTPLPQRHTRGGQRVSVEIRAREATSAVVRFQGFPMMV